MSTDAASFVDLRWIPLGAGARVVRRSGRCFEALSARLGHRARSELYHSALEVRTPDGSFVIEMTPVPRRGASRGVVAEGSVGTRWASWLRVFRYEVRCWRGGRIPDVQFAVAGPHRLSDDPDVAIRALAVLRDVPTVVWGRDELDAGEMWNSNSVTSWVLATAGVDLAAVHPPAGGRAPGWDAGMIVAARRLPAGDPRSHPATLGAATMRNRRSRAVVPQEAGPGFLPDAAMRSWTLLRGSNDQADVAFDPVSVDALPAPVARWLRRAIAPGTQLCGGVQVAMHGRIRIGKWMPFTAHQIVAPTGYLWAAEAGYPPVTVRGFDRYSEASGQMSWRLLGLVPVVATTGPDVTLSAAGRLASEIIGLTPAGALRPNVTWQGVDNETAVATITIDGVAHHVTICVGVDGVLQTLSLPRWAKPGDGPFQHHTFGVMFDGEFETSGFIMPKNIRAGWWPGTSEWEKGEFFRATIDHVQFF